MLKGCSYMNIERQKRERGKKKINFALIGGNSEKLTIIFLWLIEIYW